MGGENAGAGLGQLSSASLVRPKVFLTPGDQIGWAIDEDVELTRRALCSAVEWVSLEECEVVHAPWWEALLRLPQGKLDGKRIICHVPGEPKRYLGIPLHRRAVDLVGCWVVRNHQAARQLAAIGSKNVLIPYTVDTNVFTPLAANGSELAELRQRYALPQDSYLVGNFHRDSEGEDVTSPKLVKGPDIFLATMAQLQNQGCRFHVVLAGPRRHYVRRKLAALGIPFTYCGEWVEGDDNNINILPRTTLNALYNIIDLYVVSSRSEGGPQSIMEAAAACRPQISTKVGLAEDILEPVCIYDTPLKAATLIGRDIQQRWTNQTVQPQQARILNRHTSAAVTPLFADLYKGLSDIAQYRDENVPSGCTKPPSFVRRILNRSPFRPKHRLRAGLLTGSTETGWAARLSTALKAEGVEVVADALRDRIESCIVSAGYRNGLADAQTLRLRGVRIVHRWPAGTKANDEFFALNASCAETTILPSWRRLEKCHESGYWPVRPIIIHEAIDKSLFHALERGKAPRSPYRVLVLLDGYSQAAAFHVRSGAVDRERFMLTVLGSPDSDPAIDPSALGEIERHRLLRDHEVLIDLSDDQDGLWAAEGLACGLGVICRKDSASEERVESAGISVYSWEEIPEALRTIADHPGIFKSLVKPSNGDTYRIYRDVLRGI